MANRYQVRNNLLKQVRFIKSRILLYENKLIEVMEKDYKDKFLKQQKIDELKYKLLQLRRSILELANQIDKLKDEV